MATEIGRKHFLKPSGEPIILINKSHNNRDDETESEYIVRQGNRTAETFTDEKKAMAFIEALGGRETTGGSAMVVAAEIDGTAAHQAAHAEDAARLAKLIEGRIDDQRLLADANRRAAAGVASGDSAKMSREEKAAGERTADADAELEQMGDDSQASGLAPMALGLAPDVNPPVVERVPGAADAAPETGRATRQRQAKDKS